MTIRKIYFLLFFLIIAAGFFALRNSFRLELFGDDWLVFFRYNFHLGAPSSGEFNYLSYFLTVYGPEDMSLGLFQPLFHYNSLPYYILSFILRMFAAISIFPLVYSLTKKKYAAFIASLFFAVTFIGIEATNWVFNMPSYLAIVFFNAFLYIFIQRKELTKKKGLLLAIFFYLTFVIQPIRMTGLPIIVFLLAIFWLLEVRSFSTLKKIIFRLCIIAIAFLAVKFGGDSLGTSSEMVQRVLTGISVITSQLRTGHSDLLMNPFIVLGSLFIPDNLWTQVVPFAPGSIVMGLILPFFICFLGLILLVYKAISKELPVKYFIITNVACAIVWSLCVRFFYKQNPFTFGDPFKIGTALIGGYFIIFTVILTYRYFRKPQSLVLFLSLIITIFSFLMPWFFGPTGYFTTSHRYLILTGIGIGMFWAALLSLSSSLWYRVITICIFTAALVLQIQANNVFLSNLVATRGNGISATIWSQIVMDLPNIKTGKHPLVFYFEGNSANSGTINDVITFGFPPHVALIYGIYHDDDRIPIPVADPKELQAIVTTGKPLLAYGRKQIPLPIDQVYAFRLEVRRKIIDITIQTRKQLKEIVDQEQKK